MSHENEAIERQVGYTYVPEVGDIVTGLDSSERIVVGLSDMIVNPEKTYYKNLRLIISPHGGAESCKEFPSTAETLEFVRKATQSELERYGVR